MSYLSAVFSYFTSTFSGIFCEGKSTTTVPDSESYLSDAHFQPYVHVATLSFPRTIAPFLFTMKIRLSSTPTVRYASASFVLFPKAAQKG